MFFRSTHDNESWVSALGAVLDAATLLRTAIEGPHGQARMTQGIASHLVEDLAGFMRLPAFGDAGVEEAEFTAARARLAAAGYPLRDAATAWADFAAERSVYAPRLNALARYFAVPPTLWIGDRSPVRHPPTQ
jgi:hypothetical protein